MTAKTKMDKTSKNKNLVVPCSDYWFVKNAKCLEYLKGVADPDTMDRYKRFKAITKD